MTPAQLAFQDVGSAATFTIEASVRDIAWPDCVVTHTTFQPSHKMTLVIALDSSFPPTLSNSIDHVYINYDSLDFGDLLKSLEGRVGEALEDECGEIVSCDIEIEAFDPMELLAAAVRT